MRSPVSLNSAKRFDDGPRKLSIFGATGSVGLSAVDVVMQRRSEFDVEVVTAQSRATELAAIAIRLRAKLAVVADPSAHAALVEALAGSGIKAASGPDAILEAASRPVDIIVAAIVGAAGLAPTIAALQAGADIALANKECLVCAGSLFIGLAEEAGVNVLPVDSEHNAIFQVLEARNVAAVDRITLTASGGPFRLWTMEQLRRATIAEALNHPKWSMGRKITIDSATLMNKGLEIIEAHHLFGIESSRLEVVVHPQSVVHGYITYKDGSILAQMGAADMRIPIAHCLGWPGRGRAATTGFDLASAGPLTFEKPDLERFPALSLARQALESGNWATNVLNAANEVAVAAFLAGEIGYLAIAETVAETLDRATATLGGAEIETVEAALAVDAEGRRLAGETMAERRSMLAS